MVEHSAGELQADRPRFVATLKSAVKKWSDDKASLLGAGLAYSTLFSVAPLLIVAVGIAGLVFGEDAAEGQIVGRIEDRVGSSVAGFLQDMMAGTQGGAGVAATVVGVLLVFVGASSLFLRVKGSLNIVWDVSPEASKGIGNFLRTRAVAFVSVLGLGMILLAALVASSIVAALRGLLADDLAVLATVLQWLSPLVMLALLTVVFALMFKILPDTTVPWKAAWRGAAFTSVLFTIGTFLVGLYLGSGAVGSGFGAAAALVTLLVFAYYSAQIFLLGAEFTRVLHLEMQADHGAVPQLGATGRTRTRPPARSVADSTPVAAVWAFLAGLVLGWLKKK